MNSFRITDALNLLKKNNISHKFIGDDSLLINNAKRIDNICDFSVGFYRSDDIEKYFAKFSSKNLVILKNFQSKDLPEGNYIFVENPALCFNIIGTLLLEENQPSIHETAIVSSSAVIGNNVQIGAHSVIDENSSISDNVIIQENCVIKNASIGKNSIIQSGVKIGNPGLGSKLDKNNRWHDFPHFGKVIIEENVVIQDNTVINRGTLNDTIIGVGTRIGPNCCIAHGVIVGKSCFISQGAIIAGSTNIGNFVKIWGNSAIRDGRTVGDNSVIGMSAVVLNDIPKNEIWIGNPAKFFKNNKI